MRTTIEIPDADHARFTALARERGLSLGKLLVELGNRALVKPTPHIDGLTLDPVTGFLTFSGRGPITHEEVKRLLEDEE